MAENILFISHKEKQCGVYQFGYHIGKVIKNSKKYNFIYSECNSKDDLNNLVDKYKPECIIYNYHPSTLSWITSKVTSRYDFPQIGIIHEVTQELADQMDNSIFDFHIASDPILILKNPIVYKTGRLLFDHDYKSKKSEIPIIGSFGFATINKRFDLLVQKVCEEFKQAIIRLNIPFAEFGDKDGNEAKKVIENIQQIIKNYPDIKLEYSHDFLNEEQLLNFLSSNTLNAFFYSDNSGRGISSVVDFALSVKVPLAISDNSTMFRHIENAEPSIVFSDNNTFKTIIQNGTTPLENFYTEWTHENLIWDYERIVSDILNNFKGRNELLLRKIKRTIKKRILGIRNQNLNNWSYVIQNYQDNIVKYDNKLKYEVVDIPEDKIKFNRILDDESRNLYDKAIKQLHKIIPYWMTRKIERANIQQGFMLDSVIRLTQNISNPKIISVGCFEDTAYGALKKLGYQVEGIDPVLNYDLNTFITKPNSKINSYDVVFSTSVIEHVEDDLTFLKNMCLLAKPDGYIVLTCDFKEGYKKGDPKPSVDYRFYTKEYILNNLIFELKDCELIDIPEWICPNPDFEYDKFTYTFASIVLKKTR